MRDLTLQLRVGRAVDLTHPAGANLGGDLIGTDAGARAERQGFGSERCDYKEMRRIRTMLRETL